MTLFKPTVGTHKADEMSPSALDRITGGKVSLRSRVGLNAANFFLAEITGVIMPFLGAYLQVFSVNVRMYRFFDFQY
jgi:hypothetical protein